jgi:hypothetical protein
MCRRDDRTSSFCYVNISFDQNKPIPNNTIRYNIATVQATEVNLSKKKTGNSTKNSNMQKLTNTGQQIRTGPASLQQNFKGHKTIKTRCHGAIGTNNVVSKG